MAKNEIGALIVTLAADTAQFASGLNKAQDKLGSVKGAMVAAGGVIATAATAAAAAAGAAFLKFGNSALIAADDIGDAAARIGVTAVEFQKLQAAAVSAGGTPQLMTEAMDKLNAGLGAFIQNGGGPAAAAFERLGLSGKIASGEIATADQAFYAAAKALEAIENPAEKARLSMQLFGRSAGVDMLEVLAAGEAGLRGFGDAAAASGRIMSEDMVARLADARLAIEKTKFEANQFATVMAGEAILAVMDFGKQLGPLVDEGRKLATQIGEFLGPSFKEMSAAVGALMAGPFGQALGATARALGAVLGGTLVIALRAAIDTVTVFARTIGGLSSAIAGLPEQFSRMGRQIVEGLVRGFGNAGQIAMQAIRNLGEGVMLAFRLALGIRSPSREFQHYGEMIAEGLRAGIAGKSPEAVGEIERLAASLGSVMQGLMTDSERAFAKFADDGLILRRSLEAGIITADQYTEALRRLGAETARTLDATSNVIPLRRANSDIDTSNANRAADATNDMYQGMQDRQADYQRFWQDTFKDGFRSAMDGDLRGFATNWLKQAAERGLSTALDSLANVFAGWIGGFGGGGGGGNIFAQIGKAAMGAFGSKLPGFKNGGSFGVGGSGGTDSKLVAFRATPGERVDIHKPGQTPAGGATINIYADGYITEQTLRGMIGQAMQQTGEATHSATINTLQTRRAVA